LLDVLTLMRSAAARYAGREAVVAGDRRITYAEAWDRGVRLANRMIDCGLEPGDRVGVLEDNALESSDVILATTIAGLVRVPLYAGNDARGHAHMLDSTGCRLVVVSAGRAEEIRDVAETLPALERVLQRDGGYEDLVRTASAAEPEVRSVPGDLHVIRHTGGTTGTSKGVPLTHETWLASCRDWFYGLPLMSLGDRCLHVSPIAHGAGYFFTSTWLSGGSSVLADGFDPAAAIATMARDRIAYTFLVPSMLAALVREHGAADRDWPDLRAVALAGAPVPSDVARRARDIFGPVLFQAYGQSEGVPATFMGPAEWFGQVEGSDPLRSVGRPLPHADVAIRGDRDEPLPPGQVGQIAIRCDGQMAGYWRAPDRTGEVLVDGWLLTGDAGRMDANGYLYVLGRAADAIVSGGTTAWPAQIEDAVREHPAVVEAGVFAEPDGRGGHQPVVVCLPRDAASEGQIAAFCAALPAGTRPARVVFSRAPLPYSPVGKLRRHDLARVAGGDAVSGA
jgi:acyl-CoA synthetase (AMP-forming)/AMP-acid ligase II